VSNWMMVVCCFAVEPVRVHLGSVVGACAGLMSQLAHRLKPSPGVVNHRCPIRVCWCGLPGWLCQGGGGVAAATSRCPYRLSSFPVAARVAATAVSKHSRRRGDHSQRGHRYAGRAVGGKTIGQR
jgi:hypothetical protein